MLRPPEKVLQVRPKTAASFYKELGLEEVRINESNVLSNHTCSAHSLVTCSPRACGSLLSLFVFLLQHQTLLCLSHDAYTPSHHHHHAQN